jgi:excisionase family DNA binding protein
MTDRVLIPVVGLGVLALTGDQLAAALAEGAALSGAPGASDAAQSNPAEQLLDSDQLAAQLGIAATWLEQAAREGRVPSLMFGRWRRFRRSEVERAVRVNGAGE